MLWLLGFYIIQEDNHGINKHDSYANIHSFSWKSLFSRVVPFVIAAGAVGISEQTSRAAEMQLYLEENECNPMLPDYCNCIIVIVLRDRLWPMHTIRLRKLF